MPTIQAAEHWYPSSDHVHGFDHVLRVYRLAEFIAGKEGADLEIVLAAVLLHDADASLTYATGEKEQEQTSLLRQQHHLSSAEFAGCILRQEGWQEERISAVQHCILSHRFRDDSEQPHTLEACVLYDADKLDAVGAVGVIRALAYAIQAGQPAYAAPSQQFLENGQLEPGEPHSAYHEYLFKLVKLKSSLKTNTGRQLADERHSLMQLFFDSLAYEMEFKTKS